MRMSSGYSTKGLAKRLSEIRERNLLVEEWIQLLAEDEAFVVRRHLIDGISWPRVTVEFEEHAKEFCKSTRTLKRYQKIALERIYRHMNNSDINFEGEVNKER